MVHMIFSTGRAPLILFLVYITCTIPIPPASAFLAFTAVSAASDISLRQPSRSLTLQQRMMQQQHLSTTKSSSDKDSSNDESSATLPAAALFSPTSKYHPDQNGLAQRRRWLVVDFDGTCTEHDTTPLLPRLAAAFAARQRSSIVSASGKYNGEAMNKKEASIIHKQDLERRLSQFQQLEDEFVRRFGEAKSTLLSNNKPGEEEEEQSIHDILDALDVPSTVVTKMVSESRVLEGLGHADARDLERMLQLHGVSTTTNADLDSSEKEVEGVEHKIEAPVVDDVKNPSNEDDEFDKVVVRIRNGCESTLARILLDNEEDITNRKEPPSCLGWSLAVLSINWCPALIDASLIQPVLRKRRNILSIDSCDTDIPIWSNRVDGDGTVSLHVPGASAKRERIAELRRHIKTSDGSSAIVYIGDSSTDLAALVEADIGIIMGQSSSMTVLAERWGIQIVPSKYRSQHGFGSNSDDDVSIWRKKKLLWQVESWQEIDEMLIELDEHWS